MSTSSRSSLAISARVAELLLGGVFLAGAVLKAWDINLFVVQIKYYGVLEAPSSRMAAALGTLFVETALGVALVTNLRLHGLTLAAVAALLVVFTGLIAYGWAFHGLKDCGCFGAIEMSPGVSIGKNVVLFVLTGVAAAGLWLRARAPSGSTAWAWAKAVGCAGLAGAVVGCAWTQLEPAVEPAGPKGPFAQFVFEDQGQSFDLGKDEYLVAMLSTGCDHCKAVVEPLNELAASPGFMQVVALCYEEESCPFEDFRAITGAQFPLNSLGKAVRPFFDFVDVPPRFIYIRDGRQVAFWDEKLPAADAVLQARTKGWAASRPSPRKPAGS